MNDSQRLQLQDLIRANDTTDQTELMRQLKHSAILRKDVDRLVELRDDKNNADSGQMMTECSFLFTYYTDIFNKVKKCEIDVDLLYRFLDVLKQIEDGELSQHEGSFQVGTILKELYIDSALKKADKLNADTPIKEQMKPVHNISWKEFATR
jgi:hypothetical protein